MIKIKSKLWLLLASIILFNSCALFRSDYKTPQVDTPTNWAHSKNYPTNNLNLSDTSWWHRFNDPILDNLIDQALINNNNIQIAVGNIEIAQAQLKQVNMGWIPTLGLGAAAGSGQVLNLSGISPALTAGVPIAGTSDFSFYQAGLVPVYSINIFKLLKQSDAAKANLEGATYSKDATRLAVISQVVGSYFSLLALQEQLMEQQQVIKDLTQLVKLAKIQYKYGVVALTDIQSYQEQLQNAKMNIPNIENNINHTQNALQILINKNPSNIIIGSKFASITIVDKIPINTPSSVLNNRPDIKQAEQNLKAANANIGVARANYFPNISLTAPVSAFSSQLTSLFNPSGDFWSAQIAATMPILNLSINQLVKQAKGQYYVAYYNYIQTVRSAFAEVDNNLSSYVKTQAIYATAKEMNKTAQLNADLNYKNYKLGYISYPESLSSKITADNNKIIVTQTKLQQLQTIINLYQSMAGGYNYKNTNEAKPFGDSHDISS